MGGMGGGRRLCGKTKQFDMHLLLLFNFIKKKTISFHNFFWNFMLLFAQRGGGGGGRMEEINL